LIVAQVVCARAGPSKQEAMGWQRRESFVAARVPAEVFDNGVKCRAGRGLMAPRIAARQGVQSLGFGVGYKAQRTGSLSSTP
jgi:hypothetical protein